MARMRAIEQRRWLLRATTTGISAIVDPAGRVVASADFGAPAVLEGEVYPLQTTTPYQRRGDLVAWCAIGLVVGASIWVMMRMLQHGGNP
jgi:apolipoprotein N-acyltransferase